MLLQTQTNAQIQIKGKILSVSNKEFIENSSHKILSTQNPKNTTFYLSDEKFIIKNPNKTITYRLSEKDTVSISGEMVISYLTIFNNQLKMIAASEISGEPNKIKIAIFNMEGDQKFIEYLCEIKNLLPPHWIRNY